MTVSTYSLISLSEMKNFPGFTSLASSEDAILEALIDAVTLDFESEWGCYGVQRTAISERHNWKSIVIDSPGASKIWLTHSPVVSITSITDPAVNTVLSTAYSIDYDDGCLVNPCGWTVPVDANGFESHWTVVYTAGHVAATANVPANIKQAAKMWCASLYKRTDRDVTSKKIGELTLTYRDGGANAGLPPEIRSMISEWKRVSI